MEETLHIAHLETEADAGDPDAMYMLGNCYAYGNHVPINIRKALDLWMAAALQGHAGAVFRIGMCYALGTCVPHDTETAVQMWRRAAADGCTEAMHTLGICHLNGEGVPQSTPEAVKWFLLANARSHAESKEVLSELSQTITDEDRDEGVRLMREWLKRASEPSADTPVPA
jgi:TPR repeat protein